MEDSESEYEEEEVVILVELNGIIDTNFLLEKPEPTKILGIETERPILQLGHYIFAGEYEDTLGTLVAFKPVEKKNETEQTEYKYCCKTDKKLSMKRIFLQEKGIDLNAKELTAEEVQKLASPENCRIDDENSSSSTKDVKSVAIDNGFAEAISNIQYPDMDIVKSIESIYANGILSESPNIVNNLIVHVNIPENTLSTVGNSVNQNETNFTEAKNLNDLISNDTDMKDNFPVQHPSPINYKKQGIKRRRSSDNDNFSDNDNELNIAREITDNIIESVAVNEDKLLKHLESEHTNESEVNTPFAVQNVLEGINSVVGGSSLAVASEILNSQLIATDFEVSDNVPEVSTIGSFLQNVQTCRNVNSVEESSEIISNFVSLIHEENSDNLNNTTDPPTSNSTVSVGTSYCPLYQDQDVESSTDKVKLPIPQQESQFVDENKCSSSGDMKILGHENRLSSEISQSSDLRVSAVSVGGEVSQSSKNSASDIAESSESVGHTSSRYHDHVEEDIDTIAQPYSFDQASSGPCISSDDIELNVQDTSMSCENELENNQGSSQCEVSQSKNEGSTYADSMGNNSKDSNECEACGQSDDPTSLSAPNLIEDVKNACASSVPDVCGQSDDPANEASSPTLIGDVRNPCASSDVCGQSDDLANEVSPSLSEHLKNICAPSVSVCGQSDDTAYEEVENPCASSDICGQSDDLAYEVENPCASSDVCGQSDDSVYEEVKNQCASSDVCGQSDDPTYEEVKEPCASSDVCGQSDNLVFAEVENPCASSDVCGQSDDQVYEASSPSLNDNVINPCASSDVCGQSDDLAYETISPSFHAEVNPCASSYVCGQSDDQVYEASSPNENDEVINSCASSNVCGQSDDPAYEATSPSLINDISPCAPSNVCGQSHDPDQKASSPTLNEDMQNPCASSNDCGQSDVPGYDAPSPSLNEDVRYPCASSDVCGQSDDPTYESMPAIVSEDIKNPCASSDICGQSDEISYEVLPPVLSEHNGDFCASSMPDICGQSDVLSHETSVISGSENNKNPCASSDDVIVDNSEASENQQEVKNSLCEVSQSSKIQNDNQEIHDGNISYEYDLKDTNECEVYDQPSENAFDLSVSRTHAHEELRDPCASSDDVKDNFHEVSPGNQARGRSKLSSSGCEVTQSSKFEDNIAVVPDIQQSFEDSGDSNECEEIKGDSNECEEIKPKRTICKATQSSRFDAGPSNVYEPFSENRESSNECEESISQNFSCEVTQSSKFEVEEETYIILDEDDSSEYEESSIGCEREISQSFTSGDARLVPADEDQCSNPYDDTSSRSFTCEVTQSFRTGDDAFVVPESQVHEEISNEHENQFSSPVCEVSQSFRPEIQNIVHDVESLIDDRDDLNECEVYDASLHSCNELNDYSRVATDPCESSDDVQLRAITPSKTSIEGECSSSSKIAPSVPIDGEQSSSIDDSFPNPDRSVGDQSVNDISTEDQEASFVGDLKLNCESSTPSTSMVNVSSSSSVRSSHAVYSSPGIISGSSEINIQAVIDVDESPVQLSSSGNIRNPVDGDNFIDSSSSSSSVELISYDVDLLPSESTDAVTNAISPLINHPMVDSPVGSSVTQSLVSHTNDRLNNEVHLVQGSDDSNDIIEVVESSTSANSHREFHNQAEISHSKIDQVEDEEVQILDSVQGSPNKEKCSSSNTTLVCTSGKSTSGPLLGNEASSSKQGDPYEFSDVMDAEIEICDSEEENSEKYHMSVNSSNEASSSQPEMQDNMPSLLEVIVSSASDFRNSLIHESSGFVRNNSRNLLIGEVTESSSINIHTESQQESLTNEAVGLSHEESEKSVSQQHHYFIDPKNTEDLCCAETEVTESSDKINPGLGCSSYASKGHLSQQQVSQSSEIENTDSSSNRTEFPNSRDLPEGTLQRDFVQSSTNISNVSTMSVSSDSYGLAEQVTSAEESMPTDQFYEPLPHEVPGSSSIGIMSEVMEHDIQSGSNVIQSSNQNPTLFEANLSMYQKIEAVDPEVSSSPCNDHVQICNIADTAQISEVEINEIQPCDTRGSLLNANNTESGEVAPSVANSELCSAPLLFSAIVEVGESSTCEVTASHIVKAIPSHEVLDSSGNAESNTVSCEVTESSSRNKRVASQKTDLEAEGSSSCSVIGSTTGAKRYEYDSSSSSSYSIVEVDYDEESKSSANEAEVLSPDLIIETNDSESVINNDEAACDLYICESSKSSENNSKNSSICEVTESCTAELNESSESFTNESKVSSCSATASTSVQQMDTGLYNENEFNALSSHEAVAKSYDMLPVEQPQAPSNQQSQMEAVSQSTSSAVELSMYEHVADFESDSVQSSSFEATQFSVNEQIKAISSPPQFSDSSSDNDQPKINTNPFIAPDGEYMSSENCDLSVLGGIPSLPSSRMSHTSPFQVCPFPNLMSTATDTSLFKVDPGTTLPVVSLPPFNISTPATSSFVNIASGSAGNENFCAPVEAVEPPEVPFLALPQGVYQYEVEVQESLPMEIINPPYDSLIHSSEDVPDAPVAEDNVVPSDDFKLPSSTSH